MNLDDILNQWRADERLRFALAMSKRELQYVINSLDEDDPSGDDIDDDNDSRKILAKAIDVLDDLLDETEHGRKEQKDGR